MTGERAPRARGPRRALTNVGGPVETRGDRHVAEILGRALDVDTDESASRAHVHGFHSYPARLHPDVARTCIDALSPKGAVVLDPFCGSGTVLVEARLLGRPAYGTDLNPLAIRLAELKAVGRDAAHRGKLLAEAERVMDVATERRKKRSGASRRYPASDVGEFEMHVLLELDGPRVGIEATPDPRVRGDLALVLSSMLTKLSRRAGDTSERAVEKRIAAGFPSRLFVGKTRELVERLAEYERMLPPNAPVPRIAEDDARTLASVPPRSIDVVVTSPPYPGNYDYLAHHATRLRWLDLPVNRFRDAEIGARRRLENESADAAEKTWRTDLAGVLRALARSLRRDGGIVLVLADSVVAGRPFFNDAITEQAAKEARLRVIARASQARPHFHRASKDAFRGRPRREHAIALVPEG